MLKAKKDKQRTPPAFKNKDKGAAKNVKMGTAKVLKGKYVA